MSDFREMLDRWLEEHPVPAKRDEPELEKPVRISGRRLPIEATLDLHGLRLSEALPEIDAFLERSVREGRRKVLIVHGKGYHSGGTPVLKNAVWDHLRRHRRAGEIGHPGVRDGGSGAVWVMIRR